MASSGPAASPSRHCHSSINRAAGPFRQLSPLPGPRSGHKQFGLDRARRRNEKLPTGARRAPLRGRCSGKSAQTPTSRYARGRKGLRSRQDYPRRSDHRGLSGPLESNGPRRVCGVSRSTDQARLGSPLADRSDGLHKLNAPPSQLSSFTIRGREKGMNTWPNLQSWQPSRPPRASGTNS